MIIWIIGLSGSGKTTLANKVVSDANEISSVEAKKTVLIDGDVIREVFDHDIGYSMQDRLINAQRICRLGKFLDSQGFNVVCSILSIFPQTRKWNRENLKDYFEVFIDAPIENLISRDSKGIYGKFNRGEITEVAGMDIEFPIPEDADLVINNNSSIGNLLNNSEKLVQLLCQ